jgi:hypothetical protein
MGACSLIFYNFDTLLITNLDEMKYVILLCITAILLTGCNFRREFKTTKKIETASPIVGSYELLIYKGIDPSGRIHYPYDKKVKGFATFDQQNNFSIQLYDATRPTLSNNDPFFCNDPEIRIAFLSARSCFGTYQITKDKIIFSIAAANLPNLSGHNDLRYFELHGDTLLLIAPGRRLNGIQLAEHSIWLRKRN